MLFRSSEGVPVQYVQKQLRHASISMTVDTYGRWLPQQGRHVDSLKLAVSVKKPAKVG